MAFMSQEQKAKFAPKIKALCKEYGVTGTLSVRHHSTIVLTISKGSIDFFGSMIDRFGQPLVDDHRGHCQVNNYHIDSHYVGVANAFLRKANAILHEGHRDDSDPMTDYFNCSWYVNINIGKWDKPYILV